MLGATLTRTFTSVEEFNCALMHAESYELRRLESEEWTLAAITSVVSLVTQ